jgi:hypothetical protein
MAHVGSCIFRSSTFSKIIFGEPISELYCCFYDCCLLLSEINERRTDIEMASDVPYRYMYRCEVSSKTCHSALPILRSRCS